MHIKNLIFKTELIFPIRLATESTTNTLVRLQRFLVGYLNSALLLRPYQPLGHKAWGAHRLRVEEIPAGHVWLAGPVLAWDWPNWDRGVVSCAIPGGPGRDASLLP